MLVMKKMKLVMMLSIFGMAPVAFAGEHSPRNAQTPKVKTPRRKKRSRTPRREEQAPVQQQKATFGAGIPNLEVAVVEPVVTVPEITVEVAENVVPDLATYVERPSVVEQQSQQKNKKKKKKQRTAQNSVELVDQNKPAPSATIDRTLAPQFVDKLKDFIQEAPEEAVTAFAGVLGCAADFGELYEWLKNDPTLVADWIYDSETISNTVLNGIALAFAAYKAHKEKREHGTSYTTMFKNFIKRAPTIAVMASANILGQIVDFGRLYQICGFGDDFTPENLYRAQATICTAFNVAALGSLVYNLYQYKKHMRMVKERASREEAAQKKLAEEQELAHNASLALQLHEHEEAPAIELATTPRAAAAEVAVDVA